MGKKIKNNNIDGMLNKGSSLTKRSGVTFVKPVKKRVSQTEFLSAVVKVDTVLDLCNILELSEISVAILFERALRKGAKLDWKKFYDTSKISKAMEFLQNSSTSSIKKMSLSSEFSESELRIAKGILQNEFREREL